MHWFGKERRQNCAQFNHNLNGIHLAGGGRHEPDNLVTDPVTGMDQQRNGLFQQLVQGNLLHDKKTTFTIRFK